MDQPKRVLLADDESALRQLVRPYLAAEGLAVQEVSTGSAALAALLGTRFDVAVLDLMLPDLDGFEVVRRVRRHSTVPIIMLTARREEGNRIAGLRLGADDYVVKPFSVPELVARVLAQLRRAGGVASEHVLRHGPLEIDTAGRRVLVDGSEVLLTRREFDLVVALVRNPGRVMNRSALLAAAWGTTYVSARTVDVHMAGLRRKLGPTLDVRALRGVGYRLEKP